MTGIFVLLVGPSGSGKDTFMRYIRGRYPELFYPPSYSTREIREGESQGDPYFFISREEFQKKIDGNELLEWAEYAGNLYGTGKKEILEALDVGKIVIDQAEVQGARQLLEVIPPENRCFVFISAGPWEELEERIRGRGSITEEAIQKREARFADEMGFAEKADVVIDNRNGRLSQAKQDLAVVIEEVKAKVA